MTYNAPRGCYLCNFDPYDQDHVKTGVDRKVISQIKALSKAEIACDFHYCPYPSSRLRRGIGSLPLFSDGIRWPNPETLQAADYLYIRRPMYSSKEFICFLQKYKACNPKSIVIIEIPSYPYDKEMSGAINYFALKKDRKYRNLWKKYVNYIADLSGEEEIFGIPTLQMINGIDLSSLSPRKPSFSANGEINIAFSAFFGPWHGCDLLLEGLAEYYKLGGKRKIFLHLAGGGNLIDNLKKITKNLKIEDHVKFYGALAQDQLDNLFNHCELAVGSLGLHRRSENCRDSSLKTREYLAKGIPFIYAGSVDVFEEDPVDFCLKMPSVEKPVDFNAVIEFHDHLYAKEDEAQLIARIRRYAENHVSIDIAMKKIIETIWASFVAKQ